MSYSNEEVLERFVPQFDEMHTTYFQALVRKIERAFPHYRSQVVQEELNTLERDNDSLERVKYEAALSAILDLTQQGWELIAHDNDLLLRMPAHEPSDKQSVRSFLSSERRAQFQDPSVISFIERMEQEKEYDGARISVKNLIGDPQTIIHRIHYEEVPIIDPYIQLVSHVRDDIPDIGYVTFGAIFAIHGQFLIKPCLGAICFTSFEMLFSRITQL